MVLPTCKGSSGLVSLASIDAATVMCTVFRRMRLLPDVLSSCVPLELGLSPSLWGALIASAASAVQRRNTLASSPREVHFWSSLVMAWAC